MKVLKYKIHIRLKISNHQGTIDDLSTNGWYLNFNIVI